METNTTSGGSNNKVKGLPSPKEILKRYLAKLLIKYTKWEGLLKKSESFFISNLEDDSINRKRKRPKLGEDYLNNSNGDGDGGDSIREQSKALACLDWRTNNGALTQDEKTNLHRDLRIIMKKISGTDAMLTEFIARFKVNGEDTIT